MAAGRSKALRQFATHRKRRKQASITFATRSNAKTSGRARRREDRWRRADRSGGRPQASDRSRCRPRCSRCLCRHGSKAPSLRPPPTRCPGEPPHPSRAQTPECSDRHRDVRAARTKPEVPTSQCDKVQGPPRALPARRRSNSPPTRPLARHQQRPGWRVLADQTTSGAHSSRSCASTLSSGSGIAHRERSAMQGVTTYASDNKA